MPSPGNELLDREQAIMGMSANRLLPAKNFRVTLGWNHKPNEPIWVSGPTAEAAVSDYIKAMPDDDQKLLVGVLYRGAWID